MSIKKKLTTMSLSALALGAVAFTDVEEADAATWEARTVEEVRQDVNNLGQGEVAYTIQWGDTLGVIAKATNLPVETLVEINSINNADLIIVGNTVHFSSEEETVTIEDPAHYEEKTYDVSEDKVEEVAAKSVETIIEETPSAEEVQAEEQARAQAVAQTEADAAAQAEEEAQANAAAQAEAEAAAQVEEEAQAEAAVELDAQAVEQAEAERLAQEEERAAEQEQAELEEARARAAAEQEETVEETFEPEPEQPAPEVQTVSAQPISAAYNKPAPAPQPEPNPEPISSPSTSEAAAKEEIAQRESNGSYDATNGVYIGRYQLHYTYLNGDYSPENQEHVAEDYVASRYGSWNEALNHWNAIGWY